MRQALFALSLVAISSFGCAPVPLGGAAGTTSQDVEQLAWPQSDPLHRADAFKCMPGPIEHDGQGTPRCLVVIGGKTNTCACGSPGLSPISATHAAVRDIVNGLPNGSADNCLCEVGAYKDAERAVCENQPGTSASAPSAGFCLIDAMTAPPIGNVDMVESCSPTMRRAMRVIGGTEPANWATDLFTVCSLFHENTM